MKFLSLMTIGVLLILQTNCSAKFLKAKVNLPPEPEYQEISIVPCEALLGHNKAKYSVEIADKFGHVQAFCISNTDLKNLLDNVLKLETYKNQLLELLRGIADVQEEK